MIRTRSGSIVITAAALALFACAQADDPALGGDTAATVLTSPADTVPLDLPVTTEAIVTAPERFVDRELTIEDEVGEVLGPNAFTLEDESTPATEVGRELIVLSPQAAQLAPLDDQWLNDRVRVTGTLRRRPVAELEQEIGWDLSPEVEARLTPDRSVLVASAVARVDG